MNNPRAEMMAQAFASRSRPTGYRRPSNRYPERGDQRRGPCPYGTHRAYVPPPGPPRDLSAFKKAPAPAPVAKKSPPKRKEASPDFVGIPGHPRRFALFEGETPKSKPVKTEKLIAKVSESDWNAGFRPGWILTESRTPPEKYQDYQKMYKIYCETGELVYPYKKAKGDSVKATATNYMRAAQHKKKN